MSTISKAFASLTAEQGQLLCELLDKGTRFVVIGGYAVRTYGLLRPVDDLDLLVDRTKENLEKIRDLLALRGASNTDKLVAHLSKPESKVSWEHVEFISSMAEMDAAAVLNSASIYHFKGRVILVISKAHLIEAKRLAQLAPDRDWKAEQDREDLEFITGR
jgi:hypothetical protein